MECASAAEGDEFSHLKYWQPASLPPGQEKKGFPWLGPGLVTNFLLALLPQLQRGGVIFPPLNGCGESREEGDGVVDRELFTFIHCAVEGVRKLMLGAAAVDGTTTAVLPSSDATVLESF